MGHFQGLANPLHTVGRLQCHVAGEEDEYTFTSVDQLIEDFIAEVEQWKSEH